MAETLVPIQPQLCGRNCGGTMLVAGLPTAACGERSETLLRCDRCGHQEQLAGPVHVSPVMRRGQENAARILGLFVVVCMWCSKAKRAEVASPGGLRNLPEGISDGIHDECAPAYREWARRMA